MNDFIEVTQSTLGLGWDDNKTPYHYRTNCKALIRISDIIEIVDNFNGDVNVDDIHGCCTIILDKTKYGDRNHIDVLDRFVVLKNKIYEN